MHLFSRSSRSSLNALIFKMFSCSSLNSYTILLFYIFMMVPFSQAFFTWNRHFFIYLCVLLLICKYLFLAILFFEVQPQNRAQVFLVKMYCWLPYWHSAIFNIFFLQPLFVFWAVATVAAAVAPLKIRSLIKRTERFKSLILGTYAWKYGPIISSFLLITISLGSHLWSFLIQSLKKNIT